MAAVARWFHNGAWAAVVGWWRWQEGVVSDRGHVFVSYAHVDTDYVGRLVAFLRSRGVEVWVDGLIPTGRRWEEVLREKIDTCRGVVVVMSPGARGSYWVGVELDYARAVGRPILPLLLGGEPLFGLGIVQHESVAGGRMPPVRFVEQLRELVSVADVGGGAAAGGGEVRQVGVVPNAADCFQHRPVAEWLDQMLAERGGVIVAQILSGLGGVGKTQLAAAVARQLLARGAVDHLVWVTATTPDAIASTLAQAGVEFAGAPADDPVMAGRRLQSWLATTTRRWLVVFDDLSDPKDLDGWWPPASAAGRVPVTTRRRDAALSGHGHLVTVESFTATEAAAYLADIRHRTDDALILRALVSSGHAVTLLPALIGSATPRVSLRPIEHVHLRRTIFTAVRTSSHQLPAVQAVRARHSSSRLNKQQRIGSTYASPPRFQARPERAQSAAVRPGRRDLRGRAVRHRRPRRG
jgi:methylmalonyl-CoA mutase cobalamin-binding subunit